MSDILRILALLLIVVLDGMITANEWMDITLHQTYRLAVPDLVQLCAVPVRQNALGEKLFIGNVYSPTVTTGGGTVLGHVTLGSVCSSVGLWVRHAK